MTGSHGRRMFKQGKIDSSRPESGLELRIALKGHAWDDILQDSLRALESIPCGIAIRFCFQRSFLQGLQVLIQRGEARRFCRQVFLVVFEVALGLIPLVIKLVELFLCITNLPFQFLIFRVWLRSYTNPRQMLRLSAIRNYRRHYGFLGNPACYLLWHSSTLPCRVCDGSIKGRD